MQNDDITLKCQDPTQEITVKIPCVLAERLTACAADNATTLSSVIIEALDFFLQHRLRR